MPLYRGKGKVIKKPLKVDTFDQFQKLTEDQTLNLREVQSDTIFSQDKYGNSFVTSVKQFPVQVTESTTTTFTIITFGSTQLITSFAISLMGKDGYGYIMSRINIFRSTQLMHSVSCVCSWGDPGGATNASWTVGNVFMPVNNLVVVNGDIAQLSLEKEITGSVYHCRASVNCITL